jgi:hypothetical protein
MMYVKWWKTVTYYSECSSVAVKIIILLVELNDLTGVNRRLGIKSWKRNQLIISLAGVNLAREICAWRRKDRKSWASVRHLTVG